MKYLGASTTRGLTAEPGMLLLITKSMAAVVLHIQHTWSPTHTLTPHWVLRLMLAESYLAAGRVDVSCRSPGSNSWDPFNPNSSQPRRNTPRLSCSEQGNTHTHKLTNFRGILLIDIVFQAGQINKRWMQQTKPIWLNFMSLSLLQLTNRQIRIPTWLKSDTTQVFSQHSSFCQITPNSYFLKVPLVYILNSSSPPALHSTFLLSFYLLFIFCASPQSSSSLFCSQTNSLLDATWDTFSSPVPRFSLSLFVSSPDPPEGKPSPPLSHWVSPFPLHPDCPKYTLYVTQCPDSHIQYRLE